MTDYIILKEVLRYMNVPYTEADEAIKAQINQAYREVKQLAQMRKTYQKFLVQRENAEIRFKNTLVKIESQDLAKVLKYCKEVYVMAVTLGHHVDREIHRIQQMDMLKALIMNACANVLIEATCDEVEKELMDTLQEGEYMTMRYSPGYGDVSLTLQKELLGILDTTRKIGLTTTQTGMLLPMKSVTAFIGISSIKEDRKKGCSMCMIRESCLYRRRGEKCGS